MQVKKAGALDASSVEDAAELESVRRFRKPTWIAVGVILFAGFIVWPLLTLPAGDFRFCSMHVDSHLVSSVNCTAGIVCCMGFTAVLSVLDWTCSMLLGYACVCLQIIVKSRGTNICLLLQPGLLPLLCHPRFLHPHHRQHRRHFSAALGGPPPLLQGKISNFSLTRMLPALSSTDWLALRTTFVPTARLAKVIFIGLRSCDLP